mmetsp:Transcript_17544/g.53701  ORF Transcript_17544/g.53701 Transcript_17544/m.53701 type:complete len:258 (-) Transcript_17544:3997-4770(-)
MWAPHEDGAVERGQALVQTRQDRAQHVLARPAAVGSHGALPDAPELLQHLGVVDDATERRHDVKAAAHEELVARVDQVQHELHGVPAAPEHRQLERRGLPRQLLLLRRRAAALILLGGLARLLQPLHHGRHALHLGDARRRGVRLRLELADGVPLGDDIDERLWPPKLPIEFLQHLQRRHGSAKSGEVQCAAPLEDVALELRESRVAALAAPRPALQAQGELRDVASRRHGPRNEGLAAHARREQHTGARLRLAFRR